MVELKCVTKSWFQPEFCRRWIWTPSTNVSRSTAYSARQCPRSVEVLLRS